MRVPFATISLAALAFAGTASIAHAESIEGAAPYLAVSSVESDGDRVTANISDSEMTWNLRTALKVAAEVCHSADDAQGWQFGQFVAIHSAALTKADADVSTQYRQRYEGRAPAMRNASYDSAHAFFAQASGNRAFCDAAAVIGATANAIPSRGLPVLARMALDTLSQPFITRSATPRYAMLDDDIDVHADFLGDDDQGANNAHVASVKTSAGRLLAAR